MFLAYTVGTAFRVIHPVYYLRAIYAGKANFVFGGVYPYACLSAQNSNTTGNIDVS